MQQRQRFGHTRRIPPYSLPCTRRVSMAATLHKSHADANRWSSMKNRRSVRPDERRQVSGARGGGPWGSAPTTTQKASVIAARVVAVARVGGVSRGFAVLAAVLAVLAVLLKLTLTARVGALLRFCHELLRTQRGALPISHPVITLACGSPGQPMSAVAPPCQLARKFDCSTGETDQQCVALRKDGTTG